MVNGILRLDVISPDNEGWMAGIHEVFGRDNDGYWIYNGTYTAANYGYAYAVKTIIL